MRTRTDPLRQGLDALRPLLRHDAALLVGYDPATGAHHQVSSLDYPTSSADALTTRFPREFPPSAWPGGGLPPSISTEPEGPGAFRDSPLFLDVLAPDGFGDGMTVELRTGRRYIGLAHFSATGAAVFSDGPRRHAGALAGMLAHTVAATLGRTDDPAALVAVLGPDGTLRSDGPAPPVLTDAGLRSVAAGFATAGADRADLLWPWAEGWQRVRLRRLPGRAVRVTVAPAALPTAVSRRELQVLTCLATGASDREIAAELRLSPRTVHTHLGRLLDKLDCANRTQLAVRAVGDGLLLPDSTPGSLTHVARLVHAAGRTPR